MEIYDEKQALLPSEGRRNGDLLEGNWSSGPPELPGSQSDQSQGGHRSDGRKRSEGGRRKVTITPDPICNEYDYRSDYRSDASFTSADEVRTTQRRLRHHRISFNEVRERITLTWHNINAWVPSKKSSGEEPRQILRDVSGFVHPGSLLAVLGASGAGKTTLLNILTYRNRGRLLVEGDVRVNGGVIGRGMPAMSAYIQQEDLFIGTLKVKEHLWFQSQLRMDKDVPSSIRKKRVEQVMQEMGLTKCQDVFIGIPGKLKGISGGEKKRLAVASEVLTNPPLMFCDEPTSGLDSYMARNMVKIMRRMAAKGRSIICTIHQPSSEVFELFDRVLLMAEGRVAYLGNAKDALQFFEKCTHPCPTNYNPADHYVLTLAVIPGEEERSRRRIEDICKQYRKTQEAKTAEQALTEAYLQEGAFPALSYQEEAFSGQSPYRTNWLGQFVVVLWRSWLSAAREPGVFWTRLTQVIILALIFGLTYWQQTLDQKGISNINGVLFLMLTNMTFAFVFGVINSFPEEFPIFLREHMDGMYRVDVYFLSKTLAELPQFLVIPVIFASILYWMVGLAPTAMAFLTNVLVMLLTCNVAVSFGYALSSLSSNVSLVLALGPIFVVPVMMIGGYYINVDTIPPYFLWLKYISWFTYANEILVVNQWTHVTNISCGHNPIMSTQGMYGTGALNSSHPVQEDSVKCLSTGLDVIRSFSYNQESQTMNYVMLLVLFLVYRLIAFVMIAIRSWRSYRLPKSKKKTVTPAGSSESSNELDENMKLLFTGPRDGHAVVVR